MEVVPAVMNSLLPEEIMDTGITLVDDDSIEAVIVSSPIPMETELENCQHKFYPLVTLQLHPFPRNQSRAQ